MRTRFADIDPEGFVDFQSTRPTVSLDEGLTRRIEWPETTFQAAAIPGADRDAVILLGVEPNYRWRAFNELVSASRASSASSSSSRSERCSPTCRTPGRRPSPARRATSRSSRSSGCRPRATRGRPASSACSHDAFREAGIPSVSLWSAVPHYVSLAPSPRAARALCDRLGELLGVTIDLTELEEAEEIYAEQITEAVASDPETQAYVEELERRADTIDELIDEADLPTGESLAAELTRFLRDRDESDDDPPPAQ